MRRPPVGAGVVGDVVGARQWLRGCGIGHCWYCGRWARRRRAVMSNKALFSLVLPQLEAVGSTSRPCGGARPPRSWRREERAERALRSAVGRSRKWQPLEPRPSVATCVYI